MNGDVHSPLDEPLNDRGPYRFVLLALRPLLLSPRGTPNNVVQT